MKFSSLTVAVILAAASGTLAIVESSNTYDTELAARDDGEIDTALYRRVVHTNIVYERVPTPVDDPAGKIAARVFANDRGSSSHKPKDPPGNIIRRSVDKVEARTNHGRRAVVEEESLEARAPSPVDDPTGKIAARAGDFDRGATSPEPKPKNPGHVKRSVERFGARTYNGRRAVADEESLEARSYNDERAVADEESLEARAPSPVDDPTGKIAARAGDFDRGATSPEPKPKNPGHVKRSVERFGARTYNGRRAVADEESLEARTYNGRRAVADEESLEARSYNDERAVADEESLEARSYNYERAVADEESLEARSYNDERAVADEESLEARSYNEERAVADEESLEARSYNDERAVADEESLEA